MSKKQQRTRRAGRTRERIRRLDEVRLCVSRTSNHTYAQIISPKGEVKAAASTLDKSLKGKFKHSGNREAAAAVGKLIAERAKKAGVEKVAFDRSGFKYHGRLSALADAAREGGLDF